MTQSKIGRAVLVAWLTLELAVNTRDVCAQPPSDSGELHHLLSAEDRLHVSLLYALENRMTIWRSPKGTVTHVSHCRVGRGGCRTRLAMFARWFVDVTTVHELDPFLLAAVALRESGLNPLALGGIGEKGIVQLHPRGVGRRSKFVRFEWYRKSCARSAGACQREVLEIGAEHLSNAIRRCGSVAAGLGAYNSGKCGATEYSQHVLREHKKLKKLAERTLQPNTST